MVTHISMFKNGKIITWGEKYYLAARGFKSYMLNKLMI